MTQTSTPPGWYPDPENPRQQRYWDGMTWTENRAPLAPPPVAPAATAKTRKPWYRRWWAIAAAVIVVLIVAGSAFGGGNTTSDTAGSGSTSGAGTASKAKAGTQQDTTAKSSKGADSSSTKAAATPAKKKPAKKKGLNATAGHANVVAQGAGFTLGDFKILPGWKVENIGSDFGYGIKGLQVQNTTSSSHMFSVDIKLHQGAHRIAASITCLASEANPKDIVEVDCLPDGSNAKWDSITIENAF